jgi:hypothetical protein
MNPNDVIDSYVEDVMRRVPAKDRDDVGLELRGLLAEMLEVKAATEGAVPDDSMVLAMLRDFGTPADIAARYQPSSDLVIIPAEQSRRFAILALGGVALQWALTLPSVFNGSLHVTKWWFTWGLGSLWWPGFLVTMAMIAAFVGQRRRADAKPKATTLDSDRISRKGMAFGLVGGVLGAALVISLPWLGSSLPGPLPQVFAFDPAFLRDRAPPALVLWLGVFATQVAVMAKGRWTPRLRWLGIAFGAGFLALLCWWLGDGAIFLAKATNDGARAGLALVLAIVAIDLAVQLYRQRTRLRPK